MSLGTPEPHGGRTLPGSVEGRDVGRGDHDAGRGVTPDTDQESGVAAGEAGASGNGSNDWNASKGCNVFDGVDESEFPAESSFSKLPTLGGGAEWVSGARLVVFRMVRREADLT